MPASDIDNALYWNELDDSTSRYDRTRAGPSDTGLVVMSSVYSPLLFFFSAVVVVVFCGIATNAKVRQNPFNQYLLFLSFPDFLFSFLCAITCAQIAANGAYPSWSTCRYQTFYILYGSSANAWINGVVAREIHCLLRSSRVRRKYFPPSTGQVCARCLACYAVAAVAAGLPLLASIFDNNEDDGGASSWFPQPGIQAGFVCTVAEENWQHTVTWWVLYAPLLYGIPYLYAMYVFYDVVLRSKLLPALGKRRELSVYFFRIGFVFLFMWMPAISVLYIFRGLWTPWVTWATSLFGHFQGMASALLTLYKQDVREAVVTFCRRFLFLDYWFCCCRRAFLPQDEQGSSSRSKRKSGGVTVSGISPQPVSNELSNERLVDDLGLPKQGPDFQFLDETIVDNMDPNDDDIEQEPQQDEGGQAQDHDEDKAREEPVLSQQDESRLSEGGNQDEECQQQENE